MDVMTQAKLLRGVVDAITKAGVVIALAHMPNAKLISFQYRKILIHISII